MAAFPLARGQRQERGRKRLLKSKREDLSNPIQSNVMSLKTSGSSGFTQFQLGFDVLDRPTGLGYSSVQEFNPRVFPASIRAWRRQVWTVTSENLSTAVGP